MKEVVEVKRGNYNLKHGVEVLKNEDIKRMEPMRMLKPLPSE